MELQAIEIPGHRPGPHLLITGGVHGDEFEPMVAIRRLAKQLSAEQLAGRITLIPVVNEAAFARGMRTAEDNLDLARTCPGRADGSVTERTAAALSAWIRRADYFIDLHTGGTRLAVWPLAGYMLHPDPDVLAKQRAMARNFNLPVIWGTDHRLEGRSLSVARDAKVPAIYCEFWGGGRCDPEGIDAYVQGCRNVLIGLDMLPGEQPTSRVVHVVEDGSSGAGHMQICNPSPVDGFFEPQVALGSRVHAGDLLGTVSDPLGRDVYPVRSQTAGIVIVLHLFASVRRGDSLAVVMETMDSHP